MHGGQTIDLFKLQTELVDMKIDAAVSRTIDRVVDQISALRNEMNSQIHGLKDEMNAQIHDLKDEMNAQIHDLKDDMSSLKGEMNAQINGVREDMHGLRHEMRDGFLSLKTRVTAVETKLGMVSEPRKEIRSRRIDYCFRAGWLILAATVSYLALPLHILS